MDRAARVAFAVVVTAAPVLAVLYAAFPVMLGAACMGLAALSGIGALVAGPLLNKPSSKRPWRMLAACAVLFLLGVLSRPWAAGQTGPARYLTDAFTLSGYALMIGATLVLLRSGGRRAEPHAATDGLIVCLGVSCVMTVVFSLPAAALDRPPLLSILAGLYPVIDVVMLLLLLNLGFSLPAGLRSFQVFTLALAMMFVGDIGYAWIGTSGQLTGSHLLDLPFVLGFVWLGCCALHPSMVRMAQAVPRTIQPWSVRRLSLIVPALLAPGLLLVLRPDLDVVDRLVIATATAGMVVLMLVRAVRAVHDDARSQAVLLHRATHDALTDLPNRVLLAERLHRLLGNGARRNPVCLLYLDLDGFKLINDTWGHETGDRLLIEVAGRLRTVAGAGITVARTGGDEFALAGVMPHQDGVLLAERALDALREPLAVSGLDLVVTPSIGIAESFGDTSAEGMLRDADTAMYRAKHDGRDRWVIFDQDMQRSVRDRIEIELALRQALARQQLWVAYQPLVDLQTERVVGAEALLRWNHPVRGEISPVDFIPIAEETGLIVEIGAWVMTESIRQVAAWQAAGVVDERFAVSVNASPRQLRDDTLLTVMRRELQQSGVRPEQLVVEITESVMLDSTTGVASALAYLRAIGVGLAVDDFGTGYSSLSYLSRYPVSSVKIDRAFVERLGGGIGDEIIVRAIGAMAGALRLDVVAEGVETAQQRDILRAIGVQHAQGWLWGRAVVGDEFAALHGRPAQTEAQAGVGNSYAQ